MSPSASPASPAPAVPAANSNGSFSLSRQLGLGVARIVNIAHTAFYMLAAYCFYMLLVKTGIGFAAAFLALGCAQATQETAPRASVPPPLV